MKHTYETYLTNFFIFIKDCIQYGNQINMLNIDHEKNVSIGIENDNQISQVLCLFKFSEMNMAIALILQVWVFIY